MTTGSPPTATPYYKLAVEANNLNDQRFSLAPNFNFRKNPLFLFFFPYFLFFFSYKLYARTYIVHTITTHASSIERDVSRPFLFLYIHYFFLLSFFFSYILHTHVIYQAMYIFSPTVLPSGVQFSTILTIYSFSIHNRLSLLLSYLPPPLS